MKAFVRWGALCAVVAFAAACTDGQGERRAQDGGPILSLSATSVTFPATESAAAPPAAQGVNVTNSGSGSLAAPTLTVTYGTVAGWLDASVDPAVSGSGYTVTLRPTTTALPPATHGATVLVTSTGAAGSPAAIAVSFPITAGANPVIAAAPSALSFTTTAGTNPAAKTIAISNGGGGALAAVSATPSYTSGSGWMSLDVTGSGAASTVTVSISAPAAGSYAGSVSVASAGAANSPLSIPVTLVVSAPPSGTDTMAEAAAAIGEALSLKSQGCYKRSIYEARMEWALDTAGLTAAASAGRVSHVRSHADACVAWINAATCAEFDHIGDWPVSCSLWVVGHVANGNACYGFRECANGWCDEGEGAGVCPGVCTPFTAHGAACEGWSSCGPGYFCDHSAVAPTCVPVQQVASGEPCTTLTPCARGSYCDRLRTETCRPRVAAGGACIQYYSDECEVGFACDPVTFVCRPLIGAGGSCLDGICGYGLYCRTSGSVCTERALVGEDCTELASRSADSRYCIDYSHCLGDTTKVCAYGTAAMGAPCAETITASTPASMICNPTAMCTWSPSTSSSACGPIPDMGPPSACY